MSGAALQAPSICLPRQEQEGAAWWWLGTMMKNESCADGFAFCHYPLGSLEHQNWVAGYASQAFRPELLAAQQETDATTAQTEQQAESA